MTFSKKPLEERNKIVNQPKRRPYASSIQFILEQGGFELPESCTILVSDGSVIELKVVEGKELNARRTISMSTKGYSSASTAEQRGLKLSAAILWAAVAQHVPLRLKYHTPYPSIVYDRTQQRGGGVSISATLYSYSKFSVFIDKMQEIFESQLSFDNKLITSMELFTSARLEATERTRFLGLVSSLEPLATQDPHGGDVPELIDKYLSMLKDVSIPEEIRNSLQGSIGNLKKESVGFAIKKMIRSAFPEDNDAISLVNHAYNVRSQILHNGHADEDLDLITRDLEILVRKIIVHKIDKSLI